jgi:hypothetical protein
MFWAARGRELATLWSLLGQRTHRSFALLAELAFLTVIRGAIPRVVEQLRRLEP